MAVFNHLLYRPAVEEAIEAHRALTGRYTLRQLAEEVGVQASFLTNVLKGRFDFSADQLFAVAGVLGLPEAERDYLLLLLEHERSAHAPRRQALKARIEHIRRETQKTEKQLAIKVMELTPDEQAQYYLDPFAQVALVHLNLAPYNRQPEKLAGALGISRAHLAQILEILTRIGYVKKEGAAYRVVARDKHLPARNPLSGPALTLLRFKSLDHLQRLTTGEAFSHTVTLTGTAETKERLSDAYLAFLKKAEAIVKPARSEKAFQMNFDLFPWEL